MISSRMIKFLKEAELHPELKRTGKYSVYLNRIQKQIDKNLNNTVEIAKLFPNILLDEEREYRDETGKIVSHRRLKKLLLVVKLVNPKMEVELVLKNLDFPEPLDESIHVVHTPMTS